MKIRLGYVSISKTIDVTASSNVTYTDYINKKADLKKIDDVIKSNLTNLEKIIDYNIKNNVHFYRLTSKLIPLATMEKVEFDYIKPYRKNYSRLSKKIKDNNIRIDVHPDQFTVLNSTKSDVIKNTISILNYHYNILQALNIENKVIVLHVGSSVLGKDNSIKRFINNFNKLPKNIKESIVLENDDKIYNANDVLNICKQLNIPFVLDYHHHICNNNGLELDFDTIFKTWKKINPKIHFSSPKNKTKKEYRSHHDYINSDDFINFIELIKKYNYDIDIMIEAKAKDEALFKLVRELKYKTDYHFIDETTFIV